MTHLLHNTPNFLILHIRVTVTGETIHEQLKELGGIENITAELPNWPISDDTVMHLATAEGGK